MADTNQSTFSKRYQRIMATLRNAEASIPMKIKEIGIEIAIIVFSVTLSIWLYNIRDNAKQQEEVKVFLLGLKSDLENDVKEMSSDCESYKNQGLAFIYVVKIPFGEKINIDSLQKHEGYIYNQTGLLPNKGRYEGFKSAGKLGTIENRELQNVILDLYEEDLPLLLGSTDSYTVLKTKLFDYVISEKKMLNDSTNNIQEIFSSDRVKNICQRLAYVREIELRYQYTIIKANKIIEMIEKEYGE